jgi:hypothetical protein
MEHAQAKNEHCQEKVFHAAQSSGMHGVSASGASAFDTAALAPASCIVLKIFIVNKHYPSVCHKSGFSLTLFDNNQKRIDRQDTCR